MAVIGREHFGRTAAAAALAGARLGRALPAAAAPRLAEIGLVVLLAFLLAQSAIRLFAPLPVPADPAAPSPGSSEAAPVVARNPFSLLETTAPGAAPISTVAAETTLDLKLHGTWVEDETVENGLGTAIIRTPDQKQKAYRIGDEICCGASLIGVYPGQVIISRAGVQESLSLPSGQDYQGEAAAVAAPLPSAPLGVVSGEPATITEVVDFEPIETPSGGLKFALFPAGDAASFEALGLRKGDILVSVNGTPAPTGIDGVSALLVALAGADRLSVRVERRGVPQDIDISLSTDS